MSITTIALFGEAEKGDYSIGYYCHELAELLDLLGNPPTDSLGLHYATQALLYHYGCIYFRVAEEGFSRDDYFHGIDILTKSPLITSVSAICTPGVGDHTIIDAILPICSSHHQLYITNEKDLIDYLSSTRGSLIDKGIE